MIYERFHGLRARIILVKRPPGPGKGPTAAPPSGNGSTGLALGGVRHELINVRNSRHEVSLSLVRVQWVHT